MKRVCHFEIQNSDKLTLDVNQISYWRGKMSLTN